MKLHKLIFFVLVCLVAGRSSAQSPKTIEADLLRSLKKIGYCDSLRYGDTTGRWDDSLEKVNDKFGEKLKNYTGENPSTISQLFSLLKKERLDIFTSADGLFRIYSWDTRLGGTEYDFQNVMQYRIGQKTNSVRVLDTVGYHQDKYIPFYSNLYTFKANDRTYYLAVYGCIYSSKDVGQGIQVFAIENGKLNDDVKIIKTATGLHSQLYYDYDFRSVVYWKVNKKVVDWKDRPTITFDAATKTIKLPMVNERDMMTRKFITYKFTGQYFEKVKN